ncbi:MAG: MFS transporter [Bacteroides sp. SM23_62_1]|nr:MAG: MFS transporter [Bacteroides sp. SM23_62_1]
MKAKSYVISNTVIVALGGFLFGFDTAVISGVEGSLEKFFELSRFWLGFTVAIALIGTAIGAITISRPGDHFGRKKVLISLAIFYTVSALGSALAQSWYALLIYRFLGGLAVGGSSVIAPMYIAEISPAHLRGRLVAVFQFNVVTGILIAFLSNYLIDTYIEDFSWRWMLGVMAIPSFIFFGLLFLIPNSPRWLVRKNRIAEAEEILVKCGAPDVKAEIDDILESVKIELSGVKEKFFSRKYRIPIFAAVMVAIFNQLTGINAVMYYAPRIFEMAEVSRNTALLQSVAVGFTNMVFTIIAMVMIDRYGRKKLLLLGSVGMTFFLGMVARSFYIENFGGIALLIYLIGYIAFFAVSQGAVIWVFISEIFPNKVRAYGQSLGSFTHWIMAAIISLNFPLLSKLFGGGNSFMFFSAMMVLQFFFVMRFLPETKGKSLEKIQKELGIE